MQASSTRNTDAVVKSSQQPHADTMEADMAELHLASSTAEQQDTTELSPPSSQYVLL